LYFVAKQKVVFVRFRAPPTMNIKICHRVCFGIQITVICEWKLRWIKT
jgi:hypothetical protein